MSVFSTQGRQLWSFERESPRPEPFNELLFKGKNKLCREIHVFDY